MPERFSVDQIDHVEVYVPDVDAAAAWYARVLGLTPVPGIEWDLPVMISSDGGSTKVALFRGKPQTEAAGWLRLAFRASGPSFLAFLRGLDQTLVTDHEGKPVGKGDIVDHDISWSIYFADPYGNRLEITTYEYDEVRRELPL